jgi:hypothetical protein
VLAVDATCGEIFDDSSVMELDVDALDVVTVKSRYRAPVREIADDGAVFVSL